MKAILATIAILMAPAVHATPFGGQLVGDGDTLLKYNCVETVPGQIDCAFTQILIAPKLSPEEAVAEIETLLETYGAEFEKDGMAETCETGLPMMQAILALLDGDETALERFNAETGGEIDIEEARASIADAPPRQKADMRRMIEALGDVCAPGAGEAELRAFAQVDVDHRARTCSVWVNNWEASFTPVSDLVWTLTGEEPNGICGVMRLDRFVCDPDYPTLCDFIAEKRVLNPDGVGLLPCSELDQRAVRYAWRSDDVYLSCDILDF